jgi:hypothetical protein
MCYGLADLILKGSSDIPGLANLALERVGGD